MTEPLSAQGPNEDKTRLVEMPEVEDDVADFITGYKMIDKIGQGGMGIVYKALQRSLNRVVALKVMRELGEDSSFSERFRREALTGGKLNHPNIVSVYDHGTARGTVFLVMEYVDGRNCSSYVQSSGPFEPEIATTIIHQCVLGLSHAYGQGVIHRDIKPANILLDEGGVTDARGTLAMTAKLADFGLARLWQRDENEPDLTQTGSVMGTPTYMAPEQAMGKEVDFRADIYSLGAMYYFLVTGRRPFQGQNAMDIFHKKMNQPIANPRDLIRGVGDDMVVVMNRMLARRVEDRYQSYSNLLIDVECLMRGVAPQTDPIAPGQATIGPKRQGGTKVEAAAIGRSSGSRRRTWAIAAIVAVVIALAGGLALLTDRKGGEEPGESTAAELLESWSGLDSADLLAGLDDYRGRLTKAAATLPEADGRDVRERFRRIVQASLDDVRPGTLAALEGHYREGRYDELAAAAKTACAPYATMQLDVPAELARYRTIASQALTDDAGRKEREAVAQAVKSTDPDEVTRLLERFEVRFPFSPEPVLQQVKARRAWAAKEMQALEVERGLDFIDGLYHEGRYEDMRRKLGDVRARMRALGREPGKRVAGYDEILAAALDQGLGKEERRRWAQASGTTDPVRVIEALDGFAERFPFSPDLKEAERLLAEAREQAPLIVIVATPSSAVISLDGEPAGKGSVRRPRVRGGVTIRAEAEGYYPGIREIDHQSEREIELVLDARPAVPRRLDPERPLYNESLRRHMTEWKFRQGFGVDAAEAGFKMEASGANRWATASRELTPLFSRRFFKGHKGWRLTGYIKRRSGEAELRALHGANGAYVAVGVDDREVYLIRCSGGDRRKLATRDLPKSDGRTRLALSWHGDVLVVHLGDNPETAPLLGTVRPDWTLDGTRLDLAVRGGSSSFGELNVYPLF